jgi:crossover junction endodeoxyribonuclease RusA
LEARLMLELELPFPPSTNRLWRRVGARTLLSREGRAYRQAVCSILRERGVRPLGGRLAAAVELYPPDRRRRDLDNALKGLLDALAHGGAYYDDSQIDHLTIIRRAVVPGGKVTVRLEGLST